MPALFTMMSRPPNRSTAAATSASTSALEVTSQRTARATSGLPRLPHGGFGCRQVQIAEHHPGAFGHETLRDGQAEPLGLRR